MLYLWQYKKSATCQPCQNATRGSANLSRSYAQFIEYFLVHSICGSALLYHEIEPYHLSKILCMLTNINLLTTNYMTSLIPCLKFTVNFYCDAVFSRIHLIILCASTWSNSKLSLRVTHSRYQETGLGNDPTPDMFSFYSLVYNITQSNTFKRKFPLFSCSQENKPMSHLYFHRIESGVEYFTFLV